MKGGSVFLLVLALILIFGGIFCVSTYNGLINSEETVSQAKSDIDANLQRRADLVPNLVETVKAYAAHESEVFTAIADARAAMMSAGTVQESAEADAAMSSALSRLLAVAESYPELKANQNFIDLQTQLEGTENRIAISRSNYNEAVKDFNAKIRKFPAVFFANMMGLEKKDYFEAAEGAQEAPKVDFGN